MHPKRFDEIVRQVAAAGSRRETRRAVLRALGLGGGAAALSGGGALARPASSGAQIPGRFQTGGDSLIEELAFQLEYDVEKIFRFVADEIAYEPYEGALRGVRGTLWSGAGNSVDTSLLLKALLDASLVSSRFVTGTLAEDHVATLAAAPAIAPQAPPRVSDYLAAQNATIAATPVAEPAGTPVAAEDVAARLQELRTTVLADARDRVSRDAEEFIGLLADAGVLETPTAAAIPAGEREAHVWIEVDSGAERLSLDPSFVGAAVGDEFGQRPQDVAGTHAELPAERYHTIRVQVTADTRAGDGIVNEVLLDYSVRSQDLVGEDMVLVHVEPQSMEGIGYALSEIFEGVVGYFPVIVLGQESYISDVPLRLGSGGGIFETGFGDEGGAVVEGEAVAEYLTIEVASPGADPVVATRILFDRLGDQRGADAIDFDRIEPIELVKISETEEGYLPVMQAIAMASVVSAVPEFYLNRPISEDNGLAVYTGCVHGIQAIRQTLQRDIAGSEDLFPDRPNISAMAFIPRAPEDESSFPGARIDADLLVQGFGSRSGDLHAARIRAGLLAQAGEEVALNPRLFREMFDLGAMPILPDLPAMTASAVFEQAREEGIGLTVLTSADALDVATLGVSAAVTTLLAAHLAEDRAIIIPERPVGGDSEQRAIAWWVYDPATGDFFDQRADGRSGATIYLGPFGEYVTKLWAFTKTVKGFIALGACIAAILRGVASQMGDMSRPGATIGGLGNLEGALFSCAAYAAGGLG